MTPEQFLSRIERQPAAAAYLFLGAEGYYRRLCKEALVGKLLPGDARAEGLTQIDLEQTTLSQVLDDACSLSLFASERVIWVASAELALPRRLSAADEGQDSGEKVGPAEQLKHYLAAPTPGTVIVFECSRYEFAGEDKTRIDRVARFYSAIPDAVEFRPLAPENIRFLAQDLVKRSGLKIEPRGIATLVDAVGGDASRLAAEIEKLSLFAGKDRTVTADDLNALVPNASQSNIFALVNSLARRDRAGALRSLNLLVRDGEYLPLALTFLGTQFRLTLAVQETRLQNANQVVAHFTKQGVRMWRDRAEQLLTTASAFSPTQVRRALQLIYEADKGLRDVRPDDRTVMEALVLNLTNVSAA
jgi:DNA polymerase-3 subunit delta